MGDNGHSLWELKTGEPPKLNTTPLSHKERDAHTDLVI